MATLSESYNMLSFYHQTAKLVVNVKKEGYLYSGANGNISMTIGENSNIKLSGTFTAFNFGTTTGIWNSTSGIPGTITPDKAVNSGNYAATFEALVIPQTVNSGTLFQFYVGDVGPFRYTVPTGGITWETRREYTYNVTLKNATSTRSTGTLECELELVRVQDMNEK